MRPVLKVGREVLDPVNRVVVIQAVDGDMVKVKLAGPYGATIWYPASCLRPLEAGGCREGEMG